jgi:hypothetical protein
MMGESALWRPQPYLDQAGWLLFPVLLHGRTGNAIQFPQCFDRLAWIGSVPPLRPASRLIHYLCFSRLVHYQHRHASVR